MDLRMKKTLAAIRNAFIELRSHKPLEKITIKELTEKAEISKATFYLHYQDVYDLSSSIQEEVIDEVFSNIENPETILSDTEGFTRTLFYATSASKALIDIVFASWQILKQETELDNGSGTWLSVLDWLLWMMLGSTKVALDLSSIVSIREPISQMELVGSLL